MKLLLAGECRDGRLAREVDGLFGFAARLDAGVAMVLVGSADDLPAFEGTLYLAEHETYGEYAPDLHKLLVLEAVKRESPDAVVFLHSSWGWDLAPRVAAAMGVALVSGVTALDERGYVVESCNGKMMRTVTPQTSPAVLTLQPGAFGSERTVGRPRVIAIDAEGEPKVESLGFSSPETGIDLSRAGVIVSAGRGVGSEVHIELIRKLAGVLGGEVGASRPVVDAGWLERARQVGMSGQSVSPALYLACGISGAIQHLAGMKGSGFVLAVNTDRDAPIGSVADVLVVADLVEFLPLLTAAIESKKF